MKNTARIVAYVVFMFLLSLPVLALGQVLTRDGVPVVTVTDPSQATPTGRLKGKTPPLKPGQRATLIETRGDMATVSVDNPKSNGLFDEFTYQLPLAALGYLPGKTHLERPAWLPSPAPAGAEARDMVVYALRDELVEHADQNKPRKLVSGKVAQESYAVSPDGALLAYSAEKGSGVTVFPLDGKTKPWKVGEGKGQASGELFSPDGSKLAWRSGGNELVLDVRDPNAKPNVVASGLGSEMQAQGFTSNSKEIVIAESGSVSWWDVSGKMLRSLPPETFTNEGKDASSASYVPSPVNANLMLVAIPTRGTLAYHTWANDTSGAIYIFDAASGGNYRLTPMNLAAIHAAWSLDGKRVYFSALPEAPPNGPHHVFRINADGSGLTDLGPGFAPKVGVRPR